MVSDERAVVIQIGAVLLLALFVLAFAAYQTEIVPQQIEKAEWEHSEDIKIQIQQLGVKIHTTGVQGTPATHSIRMAPDYPDRIIAINPLARNGELATSESYNISIQTNATDDPVNISTRTLVYTPDYNYYQNAPRTTYATEGTYLKHETVTLPISETQFKSQSEITIVAIQGEFRESSQTTVDIANIQKGVYEVENLTVDVPSEIDDNQSDSVDNGTITIEDTGESTLRLGIVSLDGNDDGRIDPPSEWDQVSGDDSDGSDGSDDDDSSSNINATVTYNMYGTSDPERQAVQIHVSWESDESADIRVEDSAGNELYEGVGNGWYHGSDEIIVGPNGDTSDSPDDWTVTVAGETYTPEPV